MIFLLRIFPPEKIYYKQVYANLVKKTTIIRFWEMDDIRQKINLDLLSLHLIYISIFSCC